MAMLQPPSFGTLLRHYRVAMGLTQEELAERAGVSVRGVSALENGERREPHRDTLRQLADALCLTGEAREGFAAAARGEADPMVVARQTGLLQIGSFLGAVPSGPLVARAAELAPILDAVESVRLGGGRLVLLTGGAGVGKTRLAQEAALEMARRGFLVATGRCYEPEQAVPYYPFLEALARLYAAAPPGLRADLPHRWPYLAWLLPSENLLRPMSPAGEDGRQWLLRAVAGFCQAVAEEAPLALLLDDLHWADDASVRLLRHLAHHTSGSRILLLGTYRDGEVHPNFPLNGALLEFDRERLVERVVVEALPPAGTAELMTVLMDGVAPSEDLVALVHTRTAGNAFFIQEVVRALLERGEVERQGEHWVRSNAGEIGVPERARAVIRERVARLGQQTQAVLDEASVMGQSFAFDDLHAMGMRNEAEVESAVWEALAAGLIRESSEDRYAFHHVLTQQALYHGLPPRRRRKLHLAAGEALEQLAERTQQKRPAELAWHFLEGAAPERALPYVLQAGDEARAIFAYDEAEKQYRTAANLARDAHDVSRQAEALESLGTMYWALGHYDGALAQLEAAAELYECASDLDAVGRVAGKIGWTHCHRGTGDEGIARLQSLAARLEQAGPTGALVDIYDSLVPLYWRRGDLAQQLAATQRAADAANALGDERVRVRGELNHGLVLWNRGRLNEARQVFENAVKRAEETHDRFRALAWTGNVYAAMGDLDRAKPYLERAVEVTERAASPSFHTSALGWLAEVEFARGEWRAAREYGERAVTVELGTSSWAAGDAHLVIAELTLAEGKWEEASAHMEEAHVIFERTRDRSARPMVQRLLAQRDLVNGQPASARARLEPLQQEYLLNGGQRQVLAEALLATGEQSRAATMIEAGLEQAFVTGAQADLVGWLQLMGALCQHSGRWREAHTAFKEALSLTRQMPCPYREAQVRYELGRMHTAQGNRSQARAALEEALAIFQRLGARPYAERTARALDSVTDSAVESALTGPFFLQLLL